MDGFTISMIFSFIYLIIQTLLTGIGVLLIVYALYKVLSSKEFNVKFQVMIDDKDYSLFFAVLILLLTVS